MAEENTNAKDILIALYNRNEQYHDSKDKAMWLAASVYLGFTVGLMVWFLENNRFWEDRKVLFSIFLFAFSSSSNHSIAYSQVS